VSEGDQVDDWARVGVRIREARVAARMSVRELARRIDVSSSHVSQVERGMASFSVRALHNVVSILGISMDSLFEESPVDAHAEELPPEGPHGELDTAGVVLRVKERPVIPLGGGMRWERLTPRAEAGAVFIEVVYPPNPSAPPPQDMVRHSGREYGVVVQGALTVQVGFERTVLSRGDSMAIDSEIPHRFWNATAGEVRAIWFIDDDETGYGGHHDAAPSHNGG
jgi:transcriptional regulator with XRE-family HTH domain